MAEDTYIHSQHQAGAGPDHVGAEHEPHKVVRVSSRRHVNMCAAQSGFAAWKHRLGVIGGTVPALKCPLESLSSGCTNSLADKRMPPKDS